MVGSFWAFVPALVAIVLALLTKQVYVSLFVGIFAGAMFLAEGNPIYAMGKVFEYLNFCPVLRNTISSDIFTVNRQFTLFNRITVVSFNYSYYCT